MIVDNIKKAFKEKFGINFVGLRTTYHGNMDYSVVAEFFGNMKGVKIKT
jgi:hypothetical protein